MKTKTIIIAIAVACAALFSQEASAQLRAGIGYSLGADKMSYSNIVEKSNLHGFYLTASYNINLLDENWGNLGIEPGIVYDFLSEGKKYGKDGFAITESTTEHYLDIPVNVRYGYDFLPDVLGAYVFAGPIFSFGLASQTAISYQGVKGSIVRHNYSGKIVTTDKNDIIDGFDTYPNGTGYGCFDIKIGIGLGLKIIDCVDFRFGYNFGLLDRFNEKKIVDFDTDKINPKVKTNVFYIGLGYNF